MQTLSLNGTWQLSQQNADLSLKANVPGDVMHDLYQAKLIDDPYDRENERDVQWVGEADWKYERTFKVSAAMLKHERVLLRCDGLDTFADVLINGKKLDSTDNMHRRYEWDVKPLLKQGENAIAVKFDSVLDYTRKRQQERALKCDVGGTPDDVYQAWVRKEGCNFGWDWGPVLITAGIWRDISLLAYSEARIDDVHMRQEHGKKKVSLNVDCALDRESNKSLTVRATLKDGGQTIAEHETDSRAKNIALRLEVSEPKLWWPNGMGDQPLYDLELQLINADGEVLDTSSKRIGLRTLELDRHKDEWGESFQFVVNGVPFFAKGANWIPADALLARRTEQDYRRLIEDSAAANMNMLRVWGGGIYEDDVFYDICDELGICVWQDFMFACMAYPTWDKPFMETVEAEARDNIRRLRHHACLALWCGNNELEQQVVGENGMKGFPYSWAEYGKLFDKLLPKVTSEEDPDTDYWPCSPHTPVGDRVDFNHPDSGDAHLWGVWHGKQPFEWFRECDHRFNSEFGFQSFPEPKTVYGYTEKQDRNVTTAVMEHHQRSGIGNTTIMQYMLDWFRLPTSFEMTLWTSQVLQGMAIKYACEHWRRSMPRGMGTLYWQLNDVWPVASWASIDYHGRWKALHYMARHFYAPVLVSGLENPDDGTVEVHITSDLLEAKSGQLSWVVTDAVGRKLTSGKKNVRTPINGNRKATTLRLADHLEAQTERDLIVWLELKVDGQPKSTNLVTFARPKHLELSEKPGISPEIKKKKNGAYTVSLRADSPAMWVWLELDGVDAHYSDNFVHLRPGRANRLTVTPTRDLKSSDFRKRLRVRSLVDTWQ